jgi:hypothetical protein
MKRLISSLLFALLVLAPYTIVVGASRPLPWGTFSEMAQDVVDARPAACHVRGEDKQVLMAAVRHGEDAYQFIASEDGIWVLALLGETTPQVIYRGHQLPAPNQDKIVIEAEHPYVQGGPCDELYPQEA